MYTTIVFLPLVAAIVAGLFGRTLGNRGSQLVTCGALVISAVLSLFAFADVALGGQTYHVNVLPWIQSGDFAVNWALKIDTLTAVMLVVVTGVSSLVHIYSVGYMAHDPDVPRFMSYLSLFTFAMLMLVTADNFVQLFFGWEGVGLASYLLIGFWYKKPSACAAAIKAFLVNRVGDFGFALGIFAIFLVFGTLQYDAVFARAAEFVGKDFIFLNYQVDVLTTICLLLFIGAMGKSAQIGLHTWLPDAMEGPTPVSALIHAATMVTAGVYMVARCHVIFAASEYAMWIVATLGAATAFFAATIALTQFDMKRILAYSTLSQLGYMFLGLGVGAFDSAIFHLFTHAYFKALLFLGAGSVMHAMAGTIDIRRFGGLKRAMPITHGTFLIGGLALAGFPLLSGFWSKDEIIHAALESRMPWLAWVALLTAWLTAFYTFRMIFLAFYGKVKLPQGVEHAHESGAWMSAPLVLLSVGAIFAGYFGVAFHSGGAFGIFEPHGKLHELLGVLFAKPEKAVHGGLLGGHMLMYVSSAIAILGIFTAYFFYRRRPTIPMALALATGPVYRLLYNKYYVDEIYDLVFVRPLRKLGEICYDLDRYFINGILWIITLIPKSIGFGLRRWQQGAIQGYALGMVVGLLVVLWWMLVAA